MCCVFVIIATFYFAIAGTLASAAGSPQQTGMIFLPPGATHCQEFLRLEPMQKYDVGATTIGEGEAENYFLYRGIEEWLRGFLTAANILRAQNGFADATYGTDVYQLMPQLFEYCRSHPNDIISDAAMHFFAIRPSAN